MNIKMPKFGLGIPTLNRFDLLMPALQYYCLDFPKTPIFVVNNSDIDLVIHNKPQIHIFNTHKNLGVAASWNKLIDAIFEDPAITDAIILNDDIYWGQDKAALEAFMLQYQLLDSKYPYILVPDKKYDWSIFIINRRAWNLIGYFDEKFYPAYYEDKDYAYRAGLKDVPVSDILKPPARFVSSQTAAMEPSILNSSPRNRELYIKKWGGEPGQEKYVKPYTPPV